LVEHAMDLVTDHPRLALDKIPRIIEILPEFIGMT
jgi:hypothetical protein